MTGGGASSLAFVKADGWLSIPGTPTYYLPGRNPTVDNLSLQRALERMREPGNAEAVESLAGNLEGAFAVSYSMSNDTHDDVRDIVFNDSGTGFTSGQTALSRWYVGTDYLDGGTVNTKERVLKGCIPLDYSIEYNQGTNTVRETLTMGYADEEKNSSITPGSVTGPTDSNDVPFHGFTLDIDSTTISKLQSSTLSFSNISRFQRDADPVAADAVLAAPETTLDTSAIFQTDHSDLAYGTSGTTSTTQDNMDSVSATLTLDAQGTTVATYSLPQVKPDTYDWSDVVNADADMTEDMTLHVNGGVSIS